MYELSVLYPRDLRRATRVVLGRHALRNRRSACRSWGLHRNFPRHLFALGRLGDGAGFAWLAARILLRQLQGEPAKGDDFFGFTRVL